MKKYSYDFKLKIVQEYLSGAGGFHFLTHKYGISSNASIREWVNAYNEFGVVGLQRKRKNKAYSPQFKLNAVNLYLTSELSQREVANQLGISNRSVVPSWVHEFRQNGEAAFSSKSRGRPRKEISMPKTVEPKNNFSELKEKLEETQKELLYLKAENEYLKGLRRLRME